MLADEVAAWVPSASAGELPPGYFPAATASDTFDAIPEGRRHQNGQARIIFVFRAWELEQA